MRVACWNLAGRKPPVNVNITDWLLGGENPHIIIVCLQEIVKLNPKYVLREAANQGAV